MKHRGIKGYQSRWRDGCLHWVFDLFDAFVNKMRMRVYGAMMAWRCCKDVMISHKMV